MIKEKLNISAISLCNTASCNLRCDYCYINASRKNKEKANQLQQNNIKALQDGTYLANTKKAIDKLSYNGCEAIT